jgi:predicted small lipoprotein YifL
MRRFLLFLTLLSLVGCQSTGPMSLGPETLKRDDPDLARPTPTHVTAAPQAYSAPSAPPAAPVQIDPVITPAPNILPQVRLDEAFAALSGR